MQTRMNFREDPSNFVGCVSTTNSQQEPIMQSQQYSQKLYPSSQLSQINNYDLHRRVFGQELSNYSTMPISNTNSQSQKTIGMSQVSQQNINKKMSVQTDMEGMKYYDKINRGNQIQQQQPQQQYQKPYYPTKTPVFFDTNGAQVASLGQQQEWLGKEAKKRKEYIDSIEGVHVSVKVIGQDAGAFKSDFGLEVGFQGNTISTHTIIPSKNQRLISDQDISNYSTTNSSNDTFEVQSITIENAKTRNQKEVERQYNKILNEDKSNPCRVAQYSREIFQHLKNKEKQLMINKNYIEEQPDISEHMRWILIDWLIEVHFKFKLLQETLFIAVYIIDKYLSITQIKRGKLQLVGITALFIAAKYEEIYPPELNEFSEITDRACSKREILSMEGEIICALNFQITVPSSYRFAEWYTRLAEFSAKDQCLAFYFVEMTLLDTRFLKYSPSNVAASAVYMVNKLNKAESCWLDILEKDSGYTEQKLRACAKDLIFIQQKLQTSQQRAVSTKYSRPQFYKVGQMVLNSKSDANTITTKSKPFVSEQTYRQPQQQQSMQQLTQYNSSNYNSTKE